MMLKYAVVPAVLALCLAGCNKSSSSPQSQPSPSTSSSASPNDAVTQKLREVAGADGTDCGRITSQAEAPLKTASDCVMQAAKQKHPFFVAYDMPGMTVAVAGDSNGKFYSVQTQQAEANQANQAAAAAEVKSVACPAELRIAQSGRITCFAPVAMPGGANPHGSMGMPPAGTQNPHAGGGMMTPRALTPKR